MWVLSDALTFLPPILNLRLQNIENQTRKKWKFYGNLKNKVSYFHASKIGLNCVTNSEVPAKTPAFTARVWPWISLCVAAIRSDFDDERIIMDEIQTVIEDLVQNYCNSFTNVKELH